MLACLPASFSCLGSWAHQAGGISADRKLPSWYVYEVSNLNHNVATYNFSIRCNSSQIESFVPSIKEVIRIWHTLEGKGHLESTNLLNELRN